MTTIITTPIQERGMAKFTIGFTDESAASVTPSAAHWRLTDTAGNVVNSRTSVTISSLSTSVTIVLSGADLALDDTLYFGRERVLTVFYSYTSTLGSFVDVPADCQFSITDLVAV